MNQEVPLLQVEGLNFSYHNHEKVLTNIGLKLNPGQILGVIGPNGGGKSTLLKIIVGLLRPQSGKITFKGKDITNSKDELRKHLGYVPQQSSLNYIIPVQVQDLVEMGADKVDQEFSHQVYDLVGLTGKKNLLVSELSGGEKQRALIARALIERPEILVLDEPHTGLDSTGKDQLLAVLKRIQKENNTAIIIVDHDLNLVIKNSDKVLCLNKTSHWHDHKHLLTKNVLKDIYHCEFEHLLIHDHGLGNKEHHECEIDDKHEH